MIEDTLRDLTVAINRLATAYQNPSAPQAAIVQKAEAANCEEVSQPSAEEIKHAPTIKDVREALIEYNHANGREKTLEILNVFGAKKLGDISPEDYAALLIDLKNSTEVAA